MYTLEKLIAIRRKIHRYPEPGWCEFMTTATIAEHLKQLGFEPLLGEKVINKDFIAGRDPKAVQASLLRAKENGIDPAVLDEMGGYTGCAVVVDTGRAGPVVAVRFDIDCVEVSESEASEHKPTREGFASTHPGCMHSCGHDGHLTMGIGLCAWLKENKDRLCGTIKVLFQPAEEGVRGARPMTESGILDDVDYFFGNHLGLGIATGVISADPGMFLATTKLDASFTGKAAHSGANPEKGHNALLAAATAAISIHTIARPVGQATSLNVGKLIAGQGRNVIAPNAYLQLEVRGETEEVNTFMREQAQERLQASALLYGCTVTITKAGEATEFKPDQEAIMLANQAAIETVGVENVRPLGLKMGSEDCTIMLKRVQQHGGKGTFIVFGAEIAAGHHQALFDFDEAVLSIAVDFYAHLIGNINAQVKTKNESPAQAL